MSFLLWPYTHEEYQRFCQLASSFWPKNFKHNLSPQSHPLSEQHLPQLPLQNLNFIISWSYIWSVSYCIFSFEDKLLTFCLCLEYRIPKANALYMQCSHEQQLWWQEEWGTPKWSKYWEYQYHLQSN